MPTLQRPGKVTDNAFVRSKIRSWAPRFLMMTGPLVVVGFVGVRVAPAAGWVPDEAGYRADDYGVGGWTDTREPGRAAKDVAWARAHPGPMMAAGEAACEWLETRPDAPDDGDPRKWGAGQLVSAHLHSHPGVADLPLHKFSRTFTVYRAFNHLCPRSFDAKTSDVDPDGPDG